MVDTTLGNRLTISLDPTWPYQNLWDHPLGNSIEVTYVDWEAGVQESAQPNYSDTDIVGRGELYKHWVSTANRDIVITFKFRVQNVGRSAIEREVLYPARWLDKCKYPVFDPGTELSYAPPPVVLRLGELMYIRAVITNADIQWVEPFEVDTLLPHGADVPVTFSVVRRQNQDMGYRRESVISGKWR